MRPPLRNFRTFWNNCVTLPQYLVVGERFFVQCDSRHTAVARPGAGAPRAPFAGRNKERTICDQCSESKQFLLARASLARSEILR
jgi:hypothetical protein